MDVALRGLLRPPLRALVLAAGCCALAVAARAGECPEGNLVAGAHVTGVGTRGQVRAIADQFLPPDGTRWDSPLALVLAGSSAAVRVDLGGVGPVGALILQADADDSYVVEGSVDGRAFSPIWIASPEPGSGLTTRGGAIEGAAARFLRVRATGGDGNYSISELVALCRPPSGPLLQENLAPPARTRWLAYRHVRAVKLAIALLGAALFLSGWLARRRGMPAAWSGWRRGALALLGLAGWLCWWNLGAFHSGSFLHHQEIFHHFLGAKYFAELGYDGLYECVAAADAEAGLAEWVSRGAFRDLRTNEMVPGAVQLERAARCRARFQPARWAEFQADVAWFRTGIPPEAWDRLLHDHGYNATPAWGLAGMLLARHLPASDLGVLALAAIDPLLLVAMWLLVIRVFGWPAAAVASLWWGTNLLAEFGWTGGAFLRQDWLLLAVAGVALVRRRKWAAGGGALAAAALLRVYPVFLVAGLGLKALGSMWRRRSFSPEAAHRRFAAGFLAVLAALFAASTLAVPGGARAWAEFARNSRVDLTTPSMQIGLGTLLSYRPQEPQRAPPDGLAGSPVNVWQEERRRTLASRRWAQALAFLTFCVLLQRRVREAEDWEALVLGAGLIPLAASISAYYAAVFLVYGLLWETRREAVALPLAALAAWTQGALLAWPQPHQLEERYVASSLGLLATVVLLTALRRPVPRAVPAAAAGP